MAGFSLAAAASVAAGLMIGAAATVGATLAVADHKVAPAPHRTGRAEPHRAVSGGLRLPLLARSLHPVAVTRRPGRPRPFC